MLQTKSKEKLPKGYSYPVGAETLSAHLSGIPQFSSITLSFWHKDEFWASSYNQKIKRAGEIAVLRAECGAPFYEWRIHISSVPSALKHQAFEAIVNEILPALKINYLQLAEIVSPYSSGQSFKATFSLATGRVEIYN